MEYKTKTFTYDGKRYYVRGKTEQEAIEKMALKKRDLEEGKIRISSNMTVETWAKQCIETYKTGAKENTRKSFVGIVERYITRQIGTIQLKNVKPLHCQEILNSISHLSQYTINQTSIAMNFIFKKAMENKLLHENPACNTIKPKGTKGSRRSLTQYEQRIFLQVLSLDSRFLVFALMYYCGCRPSEAINATWGEITIQDGEMLLHIKGTKTKKADRYVPIPKDFQQLLKRPQNMDYIATNRNGKKMKKSSYKRAWKALKRAMNIEMGCRVYRNQLIPPFPLAEDLVPYCFRHTYCTNLQKQGIDVRVAQYLMGHSDIKMTANIYTHNDKSSAIEAAKKMNSVTIDVAQIAEILENA